MKHFLVELLIGVFTPHGQEDVTADELVHDFAVGGQTVEDDLFVVVELHHHVLRLPVDVPRFHGAEAPSLKMIPLGKGHPHDLVRGDSEQFVLLFTVESDNEERDAVVGQRLPSLDEVHLGLQEVQVLDVGVRFQYSLSQLKL